MTEASVVGIPDELKGHLPFAFVVTTEEASSLSSSPSASPERWARLLDEINGLVRGQVGAIASLGGAVVAGRGDPPMIPKTRSGKTLRRVLRELVENAVHGELDRPVSVPSTVEDPAAVDAAREKVREYFTRRAGLHGAIEARPKL